MGLDSELRPGERGAFDVWLDEHRIFSKQSEGDAFPEEAEVIRRIQARN